MFFIHASISAPYHPALTEFSEVFSNIADTRYLCEHNYDHIVRSGDHRGKLISDELSLNGYTVATKKIVYEAQILAFDMPSNHLSDENPPDPTTSIAILRKAYILIQRPWKAPRRHATQSPTFSASRCKAIR